MTNEFRQRGATLIIGLIFLILMSIVSLSSMRNVTLQERITGNALDKYRAKFNANIALIEAEKNVSVTGFSTDSDFLNGSNDVVDYRDSTLWDSCGVTTVAADQLCEELETGDSASISASAKYKTTGQDDTYIVTVRASGRARASVMLQSTYEGRFEEQN